MAVWHYDCKFRRELVLVRLRWRWCFHCVRV